MEAPIRKEMHAEALLCDLVDQINLLADILNKAFKVGVNEYNALGHYLRYPIGLPLLRTTGPEDIAYKVQLTGDMRSAIRLGTVRLPPTSLEHLRKCVQVLQPYTYRRLTWYAGETLQEVPLLLVTRILPVAPQVQQTTVMCDVHTLDQRIRTVLHIAKCMALCVLGQYTPGEYEPIGNGIMRCVPLH
jgi:hypothetical protein